MKKSMLLFLLLSEILFSLNSYGQTQLDKEIFKVVNEYRILNGLDTWVWNEDLFKVSEKHNYYQTQTGTVSHDESIDIKGHVEIRDLGDRVSEGVTFNWRCVGENLARVHNKDLTISEIAKRVLNGWINSPPHHKLLLSRSSMFDYGSVSSHPTSKGAYVTLNVTRLGN